MSVLFYDSFWDEASNTLNAMAFQFFVKKCLDRKKQIEVIIVQMAGFSYFCNTKEKDLIEEVCKSIVSDLKSISKLNTIYYLDNGALSDVFSTYIFSKSVACLLILLTLSF